MQARPAGVAVMAVVLTACSSGPQAPEDPQLTWADSVRQRPMPQTAEERLEECDWIKRQIKSINNKAKHAQFTQTTRHAELARKSADESIAVLRDRGKSLLCPV